MTITKHLVEVYKIRNIEGTDCSWADITIDANGKTGRISIASDYGNWQNYWGACGCDFKTFLSQIDIHYAAGKFGAGSVFDFDKTIRGMKRQVIDGRKCLSIDTQKARVLFDQIKYLEQNAGDKESLVYELRGCHELMTYFDFMPDFRTRIDPLFVRFWDEVWGRFLSHLDSEKTPETKPNSV